MIAISTGSRSTSSRSGTRSGAGLHQAAGLLLTLASLVLVSLVLVSLVVATPVVAAQANADARTALMDSVTALRRSGDAAAAATRLRAWVASHPQDEAAGMLLGQVLADAGDDEGALRTWTALLQSRPVDIDRYRAVALQLQALGRVRAGIDLLTEATQRLSGGDPFAWQRAELLLAEGDWAGAVEAHRVFLRQEPHRRPLVENRIDVMATSDERQDNRPDDQPDGRARGQARQYCDALATVVPKTTGPEHTGLLLLRSSCELSTGQAAEGLRALQSGTGDQQVLTQALYSYAGRCEASAEFAVAAKAYGLFAEHAESSPYRSLALLKQAEMLVLSGDAAGALNRYLELSTEHGAEAAEALLRVARLQARSLGDPEAALTTLSRLDPQDNAELRRQLLALRADCHLRLGDLSAAADQWRMLIDDPAARGAAEFGLAEIAFFSAQFDAATAHIDSIVLRQPGHPLANDALELLLLIDAHGQPGSATAPALAVLARARLHERQGRATKAASDRAWLRAQAPPGILQQSMLESAAGSEADDPAQALALYDEILSTNPDARHAVGATLGRARALEALGQPAAALRAYETAVLSTPLDPRTPDARRHIARLRTLLGGSG